MTILRLDNTSEQSILNMLVENKIINTEQMKQIQSVSKEVGKTKMPVLLKRGMWANYKELLLAAEYIMAQGNREVILCERGVRTFETYTRNTLDINAVPSLKELTHLPVIVDPSHGTGKKSLVTPMSRAAVAAGADGLIIETHCDPENAIVDADQTIDLDEFAKLMKQLDAIAKVIGRKI